MVLLYKDPNGEAMTENTLTHPMSTGISVRDNVFQLSHNSTPRPKAGNQEEQDAQQVETSCSNRSS